MIKGTMYVVTDVNLLPNLMPTSRIVIIGEPDPMLVNQTNAVVGSILMPPYMAMTNYVNGDMQTFGMEYYNHLGKQESTEFIAVLIRALYNGVNITIYITKDEYDMYFKLLAEYICNVYGIVIGNERVPFVFNPIAIPKVADLLYSLDLMNVEEFFECYPSGVPFNQYTVMKLDNDLMLSNRIGEKNYDTLNAYLMRYNSTIKQNGKFVPPALVRKREMI